MAARTPISASIACLAFCSLAACGGTDYFPILLPPPGGYGGSAPPVNIPVAPPGASFSNATLSGTYVVSFSGTDLSGGYATFFAIAGTLTANGAGGFTSGTLDVIDPALGAVLGTGFAMTQLPATGVYSVTADGRATGTLSVTINGSPVEFALDFVLASDAHALVSRFDGSGTGSGTLDLTSPVTQSALAGSFAIGLGGVDATVTNYLATVGAVTLDTSGTVTSGLQDFNDNGNSTNLQSLTLQGSLTVGSPGTATLITSGPIGTLHFDVWPIDASHLKLIETDSMAFLAGDALVSTGATSFPAGQIVFTLTGEDTVFGPFSAGGLFGSDGASTVTAGLQDVNDDGTVAEQQAFTGSLATNGPRTALTLNGIYNGAFNGAAPTTGNYLFAAYPYVGGVLLLEVDDGAGNSTGISGGNAFVQSSTTLASASGYGLNLSGVNARGEVDTIAEFVTSDGAMSGIYDANNSGLRISDASLGGSAAYSLAANGRGTAQFPNLQTANGAFIGSLDFTLYTVDDSTAVLVETDSNQTATGVLLQQNAASPPATLFHQIRVHSAAHLTP